MSLGAEVVAKITSGLCKAVARVQTAHDMVLAALWQLARLRMRVFFYPQSTCKAAAQFQTAHDLVPAALWQLARLRMRVFFHGNWPGCACAFSLIFSPRANLLHNSKHHMIWRLQ